MAKKRLNVCVIFGGKSSEHEVSRVSALSVINNLDKEKYRISVVGITKKGEWYLYNGKKEKIADGSWEKDKLHKKKAVISPSAKDHCLFVFNNDGSVKKVKIDVAFPVLHGMYGEDGTIQGLFELADIKYVGCGVLASSVSMNKIYTKLVFDAAGLKQAKWKAVYKRDFDKIDLIAKEIGAELGYPCFVKPANAGSSVGITKATDEKSLVAGLRLAAEHDRQIVVEEMIDGREVECSVLGNDDVKAGAVGEVVSAIGFYDYDEKYKTDTAKLSIPAELSDELTNKVRKAAIRAYKAVDGAGLSRVDFFVRKSDNEIIINEINTLPGFTSISMYPKLWQAMGLEYGDLMDSLIELALIREK